MTDKRSGSIRHAFSELFSAKKPVIGVLHLLALPGAPHYGGEGMDQLLEFTLIDMQAYLDGGINGLIVENFRDQPFLKPSEIGPETISNMAIIAAEVVRVAKSRNVPVGINCLANNAIGAIAIASAAKAQFVRVNQWVNAYIADEGYIEGAAGEALRYRARIGAQSVAIFADVHVKHGSHSIVADRSIGEQARDAIFFDADALIATGFRTGDPPPISTIREMKEVSPIPVLAGSGITDKEVKEIFELADGAIVGSFFKEGGVLDNHIDVARVRSLMTAVRQDGERSRLRSWEREEGVP